MNILLVGASGYVGARVFYDLRNSYDTVGTYSTNKLSNDFVHLDITDEDQVEDTVRKISPEVIIHSANNASSKWCNNNPEKAILLNQTATGYIVEAANRINAKLIYISSMAAVKPTNLYGRTKLASEKVAKKTKAGYLILRPSLIIGYSPNTTNDRPFNRILKNLDGGLPAVYENIWNFQPTYLKHISDIIKACVENDIWSKTIPIMVPEMKTRYEVAEDILAPFGIKVEIDKNAKAYFKDFEVKLDLLKELNLPTYTYEEVINKIIDEIKNRDSFKL